MDTYVVNGVTLEYDTFDLDAAELRQKELEMVDQICKQESDVDVYTKIRNICNAMLDFFDTVIGPGTAVKICGERVNVKTINEAFRDFNAQVNKHWEEQKFSLESLNDTAVVPVNRAQRRAMMRK